LTGVKHDVLVSANLQLILMRELEQPF